MKRSENIQAPIKLLAGFILLSALPLATLGWLGWRFFEQDRALEAQRLRDRLENAADMTARDLDRALAAWEQLLSMAEKNNPADLPAESVLIVFGPKGIQTRLGVSLPYYPIVPNQAEAPATLFASAEALEFQEEDLTGAESAYRVLAVSGDKPIRAGALMRLARCLRKQEKLQEALKAYEELTPLSDVVVAGSPAELLGRRERIAILKSMGEAEAVSRETGVLASTLRQGRFLINHSTWEFFSESIEMTPELPGLHLAAALEALWPKFQKESSGRTTITTESGAFVAVWRPREKPSGTAILFGRLESLMKSTLDETQAPFRLALEDEAGRFSWGSSQSNDGHVTKTFRETGLPWTIHVAPPDGGAAHDAAVSRRNLLLVGFALMLVVIAAAGYFVLHAVNRELGVAQLQSDFVSAVSHEFRTPLTAMRHLTEMLEEGNTPPARLPQYYRALGRETRRLHEMVEGLLDFGRLESGRRIFHLEETDAIEFTARVVDDFREGPNAGSHRLELNSDNGETGQHPRIRADREALTLALRNLLDNAIKYSPESSVVRVSVAAQDGFAGISVQDEGCGIPREEHRDVFRKFVRGSFAKTLNVKGAGIGLTMASQVVRAHGGRLELHSEPGQGSRFTMRIPICG